MMDHCILVSKIRQFVIRQIEIIKSDHAFGRVEET